MKVLSYSWFHAANGRRGDLFSARIPAVLRAARALFPEWTIVIHHDNALDDEAYAPVLRRLHDSGALRLVNCGDATHRMAEAMLWRLKPIWEPGDEYVLARDLDSMATPRERWTVETFMRTGASMHMINDSPSHHLPGPCPFMLGGMVGFYVPEFLKVTGIKAWTDVIEYGRANGCNLDGYGGDQDVMNKMFHPLINGNFYCPPYDTQDRKARIQPEPLTADIEPLAIQEGWRWSEFIGHVFGNVREACAFYDAFPTSDVINKAEERA